MGYHSKMPQVVAPRRTATLMPITPFIGIRGGPVQNIQPTSHTIMTHPALPPAMPLFDSVDHLEAGNPQVNQYLATLSLGKSPRRGIVYELAVDWLLEQRHSENNYKTYRSELTTFCTGVLRGGHQPQDLTRRIMMRYLDYCQAPPSRLIAYRNVAQFVLDKEWGTVAKPLWRPFLGKRELGRELPYRLSEQAMKTNSPFCPPSSSFSSRRSTWIAIRLSCCSGLNVRAPGGW